MDPRPHRSELLVGLLVGSGRTSDEFGRGGVWLIHAKTQIILRVKVIKCVESSFEGEPIFFGQLAPKTGINDESSQVRMIPGAVDVGCLTTHPTGRGCEF